MSDVITVTESDNFEFLETLLRNTEIAECVSDDKSPKVGTFDIHIFDLPNRLMFEVSVNGVTSGVFYLYPIGEQVWDMHTLMLPAARGRNAIIAAKQMFNIAFEKYGAIKLTGRCPHNNLKSLVFAAAIGFKTVSCLHDFVKNGITYFSSHMEITRARWEVVCHS